MIIYCQRGAGAELSQAFPALTTERTKRALEKLDQFSQRSNALTAQVRVNLKGSSVTAMESFAWVPEQLRVAMQLPENLLSFGAPWLLRNGKAAWRHGPATVPFWGLGQFLIPVKGSVAVLTWDMARLIELAISPAAGFDSLASLPASELRAFMAENSEHMLLTEGRAAWVPFGWCSAWVSLLNSDVSYVLQLPYLCPALAKSLDSARLAAVVGLQEAFVGSTSDRAWAPISAAFKAWLRTQLPAELEHSQASRDEGDSGDESPRNSGGPSAAGSATKAPPSRSSS